MKYTNTTEIVQNILDIYNQATRAERDHGLVWYTEVKRFCVALSRRYKTDYVRIIGALSVLSPAIQWERAVNDLLKILSARARGASGMSVKTVAPPINRTKAVQILDGESGCVRGPKVESFFDAILGCKDAITIDVWSLRCAVKDFTLPARWLTYQQVKRIQDAYRIASGRVGLTPRELQAITWLVCQRLARVKSDQISLF